MKNSQQHPQISNPLFFNTKILQTPRPLFNIPILPDKINRYNLEVWTISAGSSVSHTHSLAFQCPYLLLFPVNALYLYTFLPYQSQLLLMSNIADDILLYITRKRKAAGQNLLYYQTSLSLGAPLTFLALIQMLLLSRPILPFDLWILFFFMSYRSDFFS